MNSREDWKRGFGVMIPRQLFPPTIDLVRQAAAQGREVHYYKRQSFELPTIEHSYLDAYKRAVAREEVNVAYAIRVELLDLLRYIKI